MSNNYELFKPKKPFGPPPPPRVPPHLVPPKVVNINIDAGKNGTDQIYTTLGALDARLQSLEAWARDAAIAGVVIGTESGMAYPGDYGSENRRRIEALEGQSASMSSSIGSLSMTVESNYATLNNNIGAAVEGLNGNIDAVAENLAQLSASVSGGVDVDTVSSIVTSVITAYIKEEEDYSDILDKITDFNEGIGQ